MTIFDNTFVYDQIRKLNSIPNTNEPMSQRTGPDIFQLGRLSNDTSADRAAAPLKTVPEISRPMARRVNGNTDNPARILSPLETRA